MNRHFIILLFTLALFACETKFRNNKQSAHINITVNTLHLPINGELRNAVWFRNNFYAIFETSRLNTTQSFKKIIVFSKSGKFIEDVFIPYEVQDMTYYNLITRNDSLYIKENQLKKRNLVLGEYVADFVLVNAKEFPIFEDNFYSIFPSCHGEFGSIVYFQDKKTKKSYKTNSECPIIINKLENKYYVTTSTNVLKVSNPKKLTKSSLIFDSPQFNNSTIGTETVFDTTCYYCDFRLLTSFIADNELLTLYSNKEGTYIGKIENKKLKPIYKFPFKFAAHLSQQLNNGNQILTCYFNDNREGILLIDGKNFNFYRLK